MRKQSGSVSQFFELSPLLIIGRLCAQLSQPSKIENVLGVPSDEHFVGLYSLYLKNNRKSQDACNTPLGGAGQNNTRIFFN